MKLDPNKCHAYLALSRGAVTTRETAPRVRLSWDPEEADFVTPFTGVVRVTTLSKNDVAAGRKGEGFFVKVTVERVPRPEGWNPKANGVIPNK
jgi:hypothetical protein